MTKTERGGLIGDGPRLGGRFRAQTVVDGEHGVGAGVGTPLPQPVREQHHEGRAVAAARDGERACALGALRIGAEQAFELVRLDRLVIALHGSRTHRHRRHPKLVRSTRHPGRSAHAELARAEPGSCLMLRWPPHDPG